MDIVLRRIQHDRQAWYIDFRIGNIHPDIGEIVIRHTLLRNQVEEGKVAPGRYDLLIDSIAYEMVRQIVRRLRAFYGEFEDAAPETPLNRFRDPPRSGRIRATQYVQWVRPQGVLAENGEALVRQDPGGALNFVQAEEQMFVQHAPPQEAEPVIGVNYNVG